MVPVRSGLTLYGAARLASAAMGTKSTVRVKCGKRVADARNALALLGLCGALAGAFEIEAVGDDAPAAARAVADVLAAASRD